MGPPGRATSHMIVEHVSGQWVIAIDRVTGALSYYGIPSVDLFTARTAALRSIAGNLGAKAFKQTFKAAGLIGYAVCGSLATLAIITKTLSNCQLPGGHAVHTIIESAFIPIELELPQPMSKRHVRSCELLREYEIDQLHFYCETADVTNPYPSLNDIEHFASEFVWNDWLAEPFAALGMRHWCAVLLQGLAVSKRIGNATLCKITRKSVLNPGVRYHARGLNQDGEPGNEAESELILWKGNEDEGIRWASHIWRRGTVPVWWGTELRSSVSEPEIVIRDNPFEGVEKYYARLIRRYGQVPIRCFNMLRCALGKEEMLLSEVFHESIHVVRKMLDVDVSVMNFDWHNSMKHLGLDGAVFASWERVRDIVATQGVSSGEFRYVSMDVAPQQPYAPGGAPSLCSFPTRNRKLPVLTEESSKTMRGQRGIVRYNCADSLDRTNISTFFISLPIIAELARIIDARSVFIAEPAPAWWFFNNSLDDLKRLISPHVIAALAEMFVLNGDVCSILYTGSRAMFTKPLRELAPSLGSAPNNTRITLQRRFQNVVHDSDRQAEYEIFAGVNKEKYFTTCSNDLRCVSEFPAASLKDVNGKEVSDRLLRDRSICWTCPEGLDVMELYFWLAMPAVISGIYLTLRGSGKPKSFDLFCGPYLDAKTLVYQNMDIPECSDGTILFFSVGAFHEDEKLYNFEGKEDKTPTLSRVLHIVFRGAEGTTLTLGQIRVIGRVLPLRPAAARAIQKAELRTQLDALRLNVHDQQPSTSVSSGLHAVMCALPARRYEEIVRKKLDEVRAEGRRFTFLDTLEMEVFRVGQRLTAQERDGILYEMQCAIADFNPNQFVFFRDRRMIAGLMKLPRFKTKRCSACGSSFGFAGAGSAQCHSCLRRFCGKCIDKAKILEYEWDEPVAVCVLCKPSLEKQDELVAELVKFGTIELSLGSLQVKDQSQNSMSQISGLSPEKPADDEAPDRMDPLCVIGICRAVRPGLGSCVVSKVKTCCLTDGDEDGEEERVEDGWEIVEPVQGESAVSAGSDLPLLDGFGVGPAPEIVPSPPAARVRCSASAPADARDASPCFSLAEYPLAGMLLQTATAPNAQPIESLLYPLDFLPLDAHWRGPLEVDVVEFTIVLSCKAVVREIHLFVDSEGYSKTDIPTMAISMGNSLNSLSESITWTVGDGNPVPPRSIQTFAVPNVEARLIHCVLRLPPLVTIARLRSANVLDRLKGPASLLHITRNVTASPPPIERGWESPMVPPPMEEARAESAAAQSPSGESPTTAVVEQPEAVEENEDDEEETSSELTPELTPDRGSLAVLGRPHSLSLTLNRPDASKERRLHLGRIKICGVPCSRSVVFDLLPEGARPDVEESSERVPLRITTAHLSQDRRVLQLLLERTSRIVGFTVIVRHGEEGPPSQVKLLEVTVATVDSKTQMYSQRHPGVRFVLPQAAASTTLVYHLPIALEGNHVSFALRSNYGGKETAPLRVGVF